MSNVWPPNVRCPRHTRVVPSKPSCNVASLAGEIQKPGTSSPVPVTTPKPLGTWVFDCWSVLRKKRTSPTTASGATLSSVTCWSPMPPLPPVESTRHHWLSRQIHPFGSGTNWAPSVAESPLCQVILVPTWNVEAAGAAVPVAGAATVGGGGDVGGAAAATAAGAASTAANTADNRMGDRRIERGVGMAIMMASNRTDVRRSSEARRNRRPGSRTFVGRPVAIVAYDRIHPFPSAPRRRRHRTVWVCHGGRHSRRRRGRLGAIRQRRHLPRSSHRVRARDGQRHTCRRRGSRRDRSLDPPAPRVRRSR